MTSEIQKRENEIIRISINKYQGHEYIDIRQFYREESSGEYKPTKKGCTFHPELLDEVIDALKKLKE